MTVILLREVLLEIGLSFKSSDSKEKLIDKVTHARSSLNITRDITRPVGHFKQREYDGAAYAANISSIPRHKFRAV